MINIFYGYVVHLFFLLPNLGKIIPRDKKAGSEFSTGPASESFNV